MSAKISDELLELAAIMGIGVTPETTEAELQRKVLNSTALPPGLQERATAEGVTISRGTTYESARNRVGEAIVKRRGYCADMILQLDNKYLKIVGLRYGGKIVIVPVTHADAMWDVPKGSTPTTVDVTDLDAATIVTRLTSKF